MRLLEGGADIATIALFLAGLPQFVGIFGGSGARFACKPRVGVAADRGIL